MSDEDEYGIEDLSNTKAKLELLERREKKQEKKAEKKIQKKEEPKKEELANFNEVKDTI